ncbi:GNAT family protein [Schumannella luteola]|uniref:RimJ/RimL family protein N-acetyltransferase n=1 Tax=Schumannella luteola TaxID=472059 RepID=A0A852Y9L1_9MICO|nr:GNAT family protein [Schumannella luteola]NYG98060.1 RimJ/RimL family protein N-acetyltransferase [Schumannella luteola]TPX01789.1 GNAT family N-acetyltransferase [Schumannella luteola]
MTTPSTLESIWPLFTLKLTTPRLQLTPIRDEHMPALVDAAVAGVHPAERMPFDTPWTDADPAQLAHNLTTYHWSLRSQSSPAHWVIAFAVLHDGCPIGIQEVHAREFPTRRTVVSGSWLSASQQGRGFGREMRAALLLFAFDELGAEVAETNALDWNTASLTVSARLGYREVGHQATESRPGTPETQTDLRVSRSEFIRPHWELDVAGADAARHELLGAANAERSSES